MSFWSGKKVCVTGGAGFVGSYLTEQLVDHGADVTVAEGPACDTSRIAHILDRVQVVCGDLRDAGLARRATEGQYAVLHLAGKVAGIEYNRTHHAEMFSVNMELATSVLGAAAAGGVQRFLVVSSGVVYPPDAPVPIGEDAAEGAAPERVNQGYGWAKRMSELLGAYYDAESSMSVAVCRPFNMYGPRDHWDDRISHVIPALIKRTLDGEDPVTVWGSGGQVRSFLHARDGATAMRLIAEKAPGPEPVNVAHPDEYTVAQVAELILKTSGSKAT
ncbi:MAG: NAD-dependent epimerase/dehydratase family protein, partial [Actinomycetota bacterium]